jgi:CTP-dependent riboflavin kinase
MAAPEPPSISRMVTQRDLSGVVQAGRGLGAPLMADPSVLERLQQLAGLRLVPGTLNVHLPRALDRDESWRYVAASDIAADWEARTGQSGYFIASVLIAGRFRGVAFQAVEPEGLGYPADQIELFSDAYLRSELALEDGDAIEVAIASDVA